MRFFILVCRKSCVYLKFFIIKKRKEQEKKIFEQIKGNVYKLRLIYWEL